MDRWKLWSVLLLTIPFYIDSEETKQLHKTIGSKPDVTPICSNETQNAIAFIVCKIRTERNAGEECVLVYDIEKGFKHECDSRFKLMTQNQTVFLHLTSLTPEDSGSYTCQCFRLDGVFILHLNITVEEDEDASMSTKMAEIPLHIVLIGVFVLIMITGVFLGLIYRTKTKGYCSRSATSGLSVSETPGSADKDDHDDVYTSLQQPASDVYQTFPNPASKIVTVHLDNQEAHGEEADQSCGIYGNIQTKESR